MEHNQQLSECFKIRASAAYQIMGVKAFGKTGETYCKQWLKERLFKRREEIKSRYLDKGNESEEDAFTLLCLELNLGMVYKNVKYFENEYMCGTPDLIIGDTVYDNKCSWSLATFPMFESEIPNDDYEVQLQVYMELTKCDKAKLCYTLIDAPKEIVEREIRWCLTPDDAYKKTLNLVYTKEYFDLLKAELFPLSELDCFVEIPQSDRIKCFDIIKDADKIKKLESRVSHAREYINELITKNHE